MDVSTISDGFHAGQPDGSMAAGPQNTPPGGAALQDEAGVGSLDKVRDILFGAQLRDVDRRFAHLEERLTRYAAELAEQLRRQAATLEELMKTEAAALGQRLVAEAEVRAEAATRLTRELGDTATTFDRRAGALEARLDTAQHDLRQEIADLAQRLSNEMRERFDDVVSRLGSTLSELRADKADRAALAQLFTEMARRLTGGESGQGFDTGRNG
jgi:hypothetical protein